MKKIIIILLAVWWFPNVVLAAGEGVRLEASESTYSVATNEGELEASDEAKVVNPQAKQIIQEKKDRDLTEVTGSKTDTLASYLLEKPQKTLAWNNFLQILIREAVNKGLPSSLLVLLILFPLVATIIAFARHVIGLRGFGIYTPAVLSIAFLSTTIPLGIAMFVLIVVVSIVFQKITKRANLAHLPKAAIVLWGVCLSVISFLILMAYLDVSVFYSLTIFPLLILVSLSENFSSTQLQSTTREAVKLTFETLLIAVISTLIIGSSVVQIFVILNPEICLLVIFIINWLIGHYSGLRLMELLRFRSLTKKD